MLAVIGFKVSFLVAPRTTSILALPLRLVNHGGRHYTGRYSNDGVAKYHDDAREKTPYDGDRRDVAITHGGEGDDSPVDTGADVSELCARLATLDHEHESTKNGDEDEHKKEIHQYLPETEPYALHKQMAFVDEREEFQHSEDADETEHTENEEITCAGEVRNKGEIKRQGGQQVDDAKETKRIIPGLRRTVQTENVFHREEDCEHILHDGEHILETSHHFWLGLHKSDKKTKHNGHHDCNIKSFACRRIGIEHDIVEAWLVFQKGYKLFHAAKVRNIIEN